MTRMGRDTSVNPDVRIFWSWDAISAWTGKGQTGDACALFDDGDADANIDYVVCARVSNTNADPNITELLPASENHPAYLFDCSNAKNDRCTQPTPRNYTAGQVLAGPLEASVNLTQSGAGNLQNETDPFAAGEASPHDTSIEIEVDSALVPTGVRLANVCSYPSAGNGGNNNPFDCIVTPGVQYGTLVVNKTLVNDNGGTATVGSFQFTVGSGSATTGVVAATSFTPSPAGSTTNGSNSIQLAVGTYSVAEVGLPISGYTTTYANGSNANTNCTSLTVTAGGTTTCTITNNDQAATLIVKKLVVNNSGGANVATDFSFQVNGAPAVSFLQDPNDADAKKGENTLTVNAGTYTVTEPSFNGYSATYSNCTSVVIANGGSATCTITNDDPKASPSGSTAQSWTLHDSATLSGIVAGGTAGATTLNGAITAGATSIVVASATGFPTDSEYLITVGTEKMLVTSGFGTTTWTVVRGYAATTAAAHASGDAVAGSATVIFKLYYNAASSSCAAAPVFTQAVVAGASVGTTGGYTTSTAGYYSWRIWYSGDSNNNSFNKACGSEVTQVIKTE